MTHPVKGYLNTFTPRLVAMVAMLAFVLCASPAWADEEPVAAISITPPKVRLEAGKATELTIRITVPHGVHAYLDKGDGGNLDAVAIDFSKLEAAGITVRELARPPGERDDKVKATVLRGVGKFKYRLTVRPGARVSEDAYAIIVRSQLCTEGPRSVCYFPKEKPLTLTAQIASVPEGPGVAANGLWKWLLLAFVAGLALNVMPCVLPVVSIKVFSFVQQAGQSRRRVLALGAMFALGMLLVFEILAGLAAFAQLSWGQQFQSVTFLVAMIGVVFAFALSLFGVFEFRLPQSVSQVGAGPAREGLADAFGKGIMATLLATPCSGPFLGSTLAWTLRQPVTTIFAVFTMMGLGMAVPYVLLTAFPFLLKFLPKPGAWMETFKQVMGFLLVGTAVYLLTILKPADLDRTLAFLVFVALGCWSWGRYSLRMRTPAGRLAVLPTALAVIALGAWLSFAVGPDLLAEPDFWEPFDEVKLAQYRREGRSVFIDFTADWCPNCKTNEALVFNSKAFGALIEAKKVIAMKADITHAGERTDRIHRFLKKNWNVQSIPFMVLYSPDKPNDPYTKHELVSRKEVLEKLEALPDPPTPR